MYLHINQVHPLRRHYSVAPRQAIGQLDMGGIAMLLVGVVLGAVGYSLLYGKSAGGAAKCPVSREQWEEEAQKYDCRIGESDYWMDRATEGMSDDEAEDAIDEAGERCMKRVRDHWREDEIVI